jgi:hypothetical protein
LRRLTAGPARDQLVACLRAATNVQVRRSLEMWAEVDALLGLPQRSPPSPKRSVDVIDTVGPAPASTQGQREQSEGRVGVLRSVYNAHVTTAQGGGLLAPA